VYFDVVDLDFERGRATRKTGYFGARDGGGYPEEEIEIFKVIKMAKKASSPIW
jgi:hypothetical protein